MVDLAAAIKDRAVREILDDCPTDLEAVKGLCAFFASTLLHLTLEQTGGWEARLEEVEGRIHNLATRGIAMAPGQTIADVYRYREPLYRRYAHLTVPADGQSLAETVVSVQQALTQYK